MTKIKEICSFQSGGTPTKGNPNFFNGNIPWITTVALNGEIIDEKNAIDWITEEAIRKSAAKIVPAGSIMVGTRVGIGKVAINRIEMSTSQDIVSLINIDETKWDKTYLCAFLTAHRETLVSQARGATIKGIKIEALADLELPEIPLKLQQIQSQNIKEVTELIKKRTKEIDLLEKLVKSRFVEMFGDPEQNSFGWKMTTIGNLVDLCEAGWSGNGTQREKRAGEVTVLKVCAVTKGYFIPNECKVLDDQNAIKKYVYPQAGDLLFSRANTREMVGATAVITQDYPEHILPDKLWKIRFLDTVDVWYMKYVLSSESIRSIFSSVSTGTSGSMFNVSMEKFKSIEIPTPPIELQQQFATFVAQVDKSKLAVQKSLQELETLKKSLMQQYFG